MMLAHISQSPCAWFLGPRGSTCLVVLQLDSTVCVILKGQAVLGFVEAPWKLCRDPVLDVISACLVVNSCSSKPRFNADWPERLVVASHAFPYPFDMLEFWNLFFWRTRSTLFGGILSSPGLVWRKCSIWRWAASRSCRLHQGRSLLLHAARPAQRFVGASISVQTLELLFGDLKSFPLP
jgi:hypothetical protein